MTPQPPLLTLERNNAGRLFVGVTEFDQRTGDANRVAVLSMANKHTADEIMRRRFADMVRLMGDNVQHEDRTGGTYDGLAALIASALQEASSLIDEDEADVLTKAVLGVVSLIEPDDWDGGVQHADLTEGTST